MKIKNIKVDALTKRVGFTVLILVIYHLLTFVTIPGVDSKELLSLQNNSSLTMLSMFSGGSFDNFSIMSMGVTAYITSQIIIQLLQADVVPKLTQWSKEGETGRRKLDQTIRTLTVILGFIQALGIALGINQLTNEQFVIGSSWRNYFVIALLMTSGTFIAMWLADQITEKGLGNGISVIIATGIIAKFPSMTVQVIQNLNSGKDLNYALLTYLILGIIGVTLLIIWFTTSELRIPVQYSRRESMTGKDSYLPLKLIVPGVVPIIFASSILAIPQTLLLMFKSKETSALYKVVNEFFTLQSSAGVVLYGILIIFFTYLYSIVQIEPEKLADNFQKQEAYIPGYTPGVETAAYIKKILNELSLPGSLFLTLVSIIPLLVANNISSSLQVGLSGSSLLIITGVFIEISRQIRGLKMKTNYGTFLNREYDFD